MDIYKLYRHFWDFAFSNPESIKPNHCAVYSFAIEHCNRLGWKSKFGFPTSMAMEATGIKSYSVYKKTFDDLAAFGFFEVVELSKNQYSSNIIALKENYKANYKALDKALTKHTSKHTSKHLQSTGESIVSIDKQVYKYTNIQTDNDSVHTRDLSFYGNFETVSKNITEDEIFLTEAAHLLNSTIETVKEFSEKKLLEMKATGAISRYSVSAIRSFILKDFKKEKEPKLKDNSAVSLIAQAERLKRKIREQ